jgi:hypothetical protein
LLPGRRRIQGFRRILVKVFWHSGQSRSIEARF